MATDKTKINIEMENIDKSNFAHLDSKNYILIKGARVNNLKNIDVAIPRNKLVVITGLSGSGKSSLAFDTLFAEGQRMYVESLSAYARQFLGRMEKPEVEYIKGISPAIAVEQKVNNKNPRSTVGTTTEIYDYLKLLFARIGKTYSPVSGLQVSKDSVTDVVNFVNNLPENTRFMILCPLINKNRSIEEELKILLQKGYSRLVVDGQVKDIEDMIAPEVSPPPPKGGVFDVLSPPLGGGGLNGALSILIDRNAVKKDEEESQYRLADSVQTAFYEGEGNCVVQLADGSKKHFSDKFEADGMSFEEPSVNFFSFNNPYGACKTCEGFGNVLGLDIDLIMPDKTLSLYEGAVAPWRSDKMSEWAAPLLKHGIKFDFPIHRAYQDLSEEQQELIWTGNEYFAGLNEFFKFLEANSHQIKYRVLLSRYKSKITCPDCKGTRLRKDAQFVRIGEANGLKLLQESNGLKSVLQETNRLKSILQQETKSITDLVLLPIEETLLFFDNLQLPDYEQVVAKRILTEITSRLRYMVQVGLGYLTLNRLTSTLSGGEFQRIKLATSLGSALVGSMYILDEPSIGLHPRDTQNLIAVLKQLRDLGNTVIVVEHEEEVMRAADQLIDIGKEAGNKGGFLIFQGKLSEMKPELDSYTAAYLLGSQGVAVPKNRRTWNEFIEVSGARENNLKNLTVKFPLQVLTVVTGVSGSGKSTLVKKVLYPALSKFMNSVQENVEETGKMEKLSGNLKSIKQLEFIDQNPIGKSSRSNPVTYIKVYDHIRELYAEAPLAKQRNYKAGFFSFNIEGGRCEMCQGEGFTTIEMQFMADLRLKCESCKGQRFKAEILEVQHKGKNISEVLDMTVEEAIEFFADQKSIAERLQSLAKVGLGYVKLGQSSSTLSGGEAQRVKLASFLGKGSVKDHTKILFIFDEPTTGLHFHDISKLLYAMNALVEEGHTVLVIEHNMEVIKSADWIIDLGQEGGKRGGNLCFEGTPEAMIKLEGNYTADFLKGKLM
jgi:excinuclease ABC subunit A